ncbi:non-structural maintenance of chromosomes element 1 homolog isoform X4 [Candoia aspera]|uniref:non-structural maintenance of chromosomes element 1 homolog isoform X4 n=1 Tax=Candoia aspera TaxID=51853 RepID=UPI002FD7A37C
MAAAPTDAHRRFLQALLARGIVEEPEAERLRRLCCERHQVGYVDEQLDYFIRALNVRLQPLSMEIRKGTAEENRKTYFALMDLILLSGNGFASSTEILNLADQLKPKKMKKMEAEQVLQQLVQKKWLHEKEGEYTLHTRSILELEQYIFRHYPESAQKCHICHSLSVQKQACEDCEIVAHWSCLSTYFDAQPEQRCPHCKRLWPHKVPAAELGPPNRPPLSARRTTSRMGPRQQH